MKNFVLKTLVSEVVKVYPYAADFFESIGMAECEIGEPLHLHLKHYDDDDFERFGMDARQLFEQFVAFLEKMEQLKEKAGFTLSEITIQGGRNKSGEPERAELTIRPGEVICIVGPTGSADFREYLNPSISWFDVDTENAKSASSTTYEIDDETYYYYTESDTVRKGLEFALEGKICKNTSYKASWTRLLKYESTSDGETTDYVGLTNPKTQYALRVSHKWNNYRANVSVSTVDDWECTTSTALKTTTSGGLGGYTRVDTNIQRDFKSNASFVYFFVVLSCNYPSPIVFSDWVYLSADGGFRFKRFL